MRKYQSLLLFLTLSVLSLNAQNVGIGNTTPGFPLNFSTALGDKISLWGNSGNHYGIGVQSGLLQLHSDASFANIAFGYGASNNFTERMRIINTGGDGMLLNGRLTLKNGTSPLDGGYGAGVWLYKADNSGLLGFMGTQNNQNVGFYGGPAGWGFTYDALNSRVGIGNNSPNAPLAFAAALGKKITFYPGGLGDAGIGMAGNRLQIYADNPNADVALGYDAAGTFNERFAFGPAGSLALQGNQGSSGQVLTSGGPGAATYWSSPNRMYQTGKSSLKLTTGNTFQLSNSTISLNLAQPVKIAITCDTYTGGSQCFAGTCNFKWNIFTRIDGQLIAGGSYDYEGQYFVDGLLYAAGVQRGSSASFGLAIFDLAAGAHTITFEAYTRFGEPDVGFRALYQLLPQ